MKTNQQSLLHQHFPAYHYIDCFECILTDPKDQIGILDIAEEFIKPSSPWFEKLLALRDILVSPFNLKVVADIEKQTDDNPVKWGIGSRAGMFKVYAKNELEMLFGEDDRHLDFRVSLCCEPCEDNERKKRVSVSTAVRYNKMLGRVYFLFCKPVHRTLVPIQFKKKMRRLEREVND